MKVIEEDGFGSEGKEEEMILKLREQKRKDTLVKGKKKK